MRDEAEPERQCQTHDRDPDRRLDPELLREQLREPLRARIEREVALWKEDEVEETPRGVEQEQDRDGNDDSEGPQSAGGEADCAPKPGTPAVGCHEDGQRYDRSNEGDGGRDKDVAHVDHMRALFVTEDRLTLYGHVERARTHEQILEDRAGNVLDLCGAVPGDIWHTRASLLEADPERIEEDRDGYSHDRDDGRDGGSSGRHRSARSVSHCSGVAHRAAVGRGGRVWMARPLPTVNGPRARARQTGGRSDAGP